MKKLTRIPELLMGFDTETTGLSVTSERAISYGFCEYRFGELVEEYQFFVLPDRPISPGAQRVHGVSLEDLEMRHARGEALSVSSGLSRAVSALSSYHARGAYVVGANVARFDLEMLRRSYQSVFERDPADDGLALGRLRIIDVVEHDLAIEPERDLRPRRGLEQLCRHYGIVPGGHDALADARAAVEVLKEQVILNNLGQLSLRLL